MSVFILIAAIQLVGPSPRPSPSPSAPPDAKTLVERAIKARGGEKALENATVFEWKGRATVYEEEDAKVVLDGHWIVEPPDRAVVITTEAGKGKESTRRTVLLGAEGWTQPLYFASLARALPLRDPSFRLTVAGPRTLRVEKEGRPTVDLLYDGTGWLDTLRAQVPNPDGAGTVVEEITFTGEVFSKGVRWPRRINVSRDGEPYVDLEITEFRIGSAADLTREIERGR